MEKVSSIVTSTDFLLLRGGAEGSRLYSLRAAFNQQECLRCNFYTTRPSSCALFLDVGGLQTYPWQTRDIAACDCERCPLGRKDKQMSVNTVGTVKPAHEDVSEDEMLPSRS